MRRILPILLILLSVSFGLAQQPATKPDDTDTQALLDKIQQLEKRVAELEARSTAPANASPTSSSVLPVTTSDATESVKEALGEDPRLHIRAFGQATLLANDAKDRPTFSAGNFTLLLDSKLSDKFSALAEIALDEEDYGGPTFETVLERAILQYNHNDYLKVSVGRYFSAIGYYNTAFYNADWAQTTMGRPVVASFQDDGGLAPMQRNGISITGRIPSGSLGLHYVAEVGGGNITRASLLGNTEGMRVQARTGFNVALFARPRAVPGLQVGGSFFHDTEIPMLSPDVNPMVRQNIYTAYAVYNTPKWEFLNEAYLLQHDVVGSRKFNVPAFYTQISHRLTPSLRPYFRFTYGNIGTGDPLLIDMAGSQRGIETGARYNFSEWVGLKFEYDRMHINAIHQDINFGGTQLVFTF